MTVIVDKREINYSDIKDVSIIDPEKYHISDMKLELCITLNTGEKIYTENKVYFKGD